MEFLATLTLFREFHIKENRLHELINTKEELIGTRWHNDVGNLIYNSYDVFSERTQIEGSCSLPYFIIKVAVQNATKDISFAILDRDYGFLDLDSIA